MDILKHGISERRRRDRRIGSERYWQWKRLSHGASDPSAHVNLSYCGHELALLQVSSDHGIRWDDYITSEGGKSTLRRYMKFTIWCKINLHEETNIPMQIKKSFVPGATFSLTGFPLIVCRVLGSCQPFSSPYSPVSSYFSVPFHHSYAFPSALISRKGDRKP